MEALKWLVFLCLVLMWNRKSVLAVPYTSTDNFAVNNSATRNGDLSNKSIEYDHVNSNSIFLPAKSSAKASSGRRGKFFGVTTGATGNNLQLGLSFIVPFLNIPFGGSTTSSSYYGTNNYATAAPSYGTSTSLWGINSSSIILALIVGLGAIILIPLFIYSFTGVNASPYGRSDDIPGILTNLVTRIDNALQEEYNIDASSCLQRAICTQVTSSSKRVSEGNAGSFEKIIDGMATNSYLKILLSGTKIHDTLSLAQKTGATCSSYFKKCPYSLESINRSLTSYVEKYIKKEGRTDNESDEYLNNTLFE